MFWIFNFHSIDNKALNARRNENVEYAEKVGKCKTLSSTFETLSIWEHNGKTKSDSACKTAFHQLIV